MVFALFDLIYLAQVEYGGKRKRRPDCIRQLLSACSGTSSVSPRIDVCRAGALVSSKAAVPLSVL